MGQKLGRIIFGLFWACWLLMLGLILTGAGNGWTAAFIPSLIAAVGIIVSVVNTVIKNADTRHALFFFGILAMVFSVLTIVTGTIKEGTQHLERALELSPIAVGLWALLYLAWPVYHFWSARR